MSQGDAPEASADSRSPRQTRRGPAPFASFDHDGSDEVRHDSSPESKLTFQLPEIREDGGALVVPDTRARSHSTPAVAAGGLRAGPTPRIDISRASSSSHHDSRDSSPDVAFPSELAFREEGALDLRSSTEELAFLEGAESSTRPAAPAAAVTAATAPSSRRHSRKDSQSSEAALLGVCGRSSRISSVGSQCSALSAVSRLSAISRSPSPHRMLLETSFCGPKPIDDDPDICDRQFLEIARLTSERRVSAPAPLVTTATAASPPEPPTVAATTEPRITEATQQPPQIAQQRQTYDEDKRHKETKNRAVQERRRMQPRPATAPVGDIIRIRLKPDDEYDDDDDDLIDISTKPSAPSQPSCSVSKPATLELRTHSRLSPSHSPSPAFGTPQRKSSFCSLFRGSPDSPVSGTSRKKSLTDSRPRSASRDRGNGLRGSLLSLFRTPRKSTASPPPLLPQPAPPAPAVSPRHKPKLKYYEDTPDGIIHIPLRSPPDGGEVAGPSAAVASTSRIDTRSVLRRTVLPDGSIIIPLHSPSDDIVPDTRPQEPDPPPAAAPPPPTQSTSRDADSPIIALGGETEVRATIESCEQTRAERNKQHVIFSTEVGGGGVVFCTQLSVAETPSVASECDVPLLGSTATLVSPATGPVSPLSGPVTEAPPGRSVAADVAFEPSGGSSGLLSAESRADSSESEASSEAACGRRDAATGEEPERRGLVLGQESFDEELPYVPTTLPQERSLALPMVPVRERAGVQVAHVQRPRPARTASGAASGPCRVPTVEPRPAAPPASDKLHISLPVRGRGCAPGRGRGAVQRADWVDFEEVPERRKQPRRIQTLPAGDDGVVYVAPEHCRCECHQRTDTQAADGEACAAGEECRRGGGGAASAAMRPLPSAAEAGARWH